MKEERLVICWSEDYYFVVGVGMLIFFFSVDDDFGVKAGIVFLRMIMF